MPLFDGNVAHLTFTFLFPFSLGGCRVSGDENEIIFDAPPGCMGDWIRNRKAREIRLWRAIVDES